MFLIAFSTVNELFKFFSYIKVRKFKREGGLFGSCYVLIISVGFTSLLF